MIDHYLQLDLSSVVMMVVWCSAVGLIILHWLLNKMGY